MKKPSVPQSAFGRSLRLLRGSASILAKELGGRIKTTLGADREDTKLATMIEQAQQLVGTLGDLKGAAMKAGQILSLEASDLLPKEVLTVLRQLHDSSPGMDFATVEGILRQELGPERMAQLRDISREPIAAASIGQVHSARLVEADGSEREVVLKVQFPGVARTIDADLGVLKKLAQTLMAMQGKSIPLDDLFAELARGLKCEVDYLREAKSLADYARTFAHDARYVIPAVFPELSTQRVLTMSRESGVKLVDWLATGPTQEARNAFASLIIELIYHEFFEAGLVQTDPNYGNFLWRPDEGRLVLLDFGAVQSYAPEFRNDYRKLMRTALLGDRDDVMAQARVMNLMDPRESYDVQAQFADLLDLIMRVFEEERQPFAFHDLTHLEDLRAQVFTFARSVKHSPPPKQIAFLNRKLGGMYHLLKDANARVDLTPFVRNVLDGTSLS